MQHRNKRDLYNLHIPVLPGLVNFNYANFIDTSPSHKYDGSLFNNFHKQNNFNT